MFAKKNRWVGEKICSNSIINGGPVGDKRGPIEEAVLPNGTIAHKHIFETSRDIICGRHIALTSLQGQIKTIQPKRNDFIVRPPLLGEVFTDSFGHTGALEIFPMGNTPENIVRTGSPDKVSASDALKVGGTLGGKQAKDEGTVSHGWGSLACPVWGWAGTTDEPRDPSRLLLNSTHDS